MALEQKLQLRMSQKLIMTPSLQQAIKLLQMSKLDLVAEINHELEENPALEERNLEGSTEDPPAETEETSGEPDKADDFDFDAYFQNYLDTDYSPGRAQSETRDLPSFEQTLTKTQDLYDHLHWQLELSVTNGLNRDIALAIIGNVEDDGYLAATVDEIAAMGNWPLSEVKGTLQALQRFDPAGVFATDLPECLLLQLERLDIEEPLVEVIVRGHLELVQSRRYPEIAKLLGCPLEDVHHAVQVLKQLDPKPGMKYAPRESRYVVPDVFVIKDGDDYRILLNEDGMPRLRLSPAYRRMLSSLNRENAKDARDYVKEKCRSAMRLIKSVEERQRTIHKVATSIVKHQREFLDRGVQSIRPLILRDVADDIGMHESTVSRVVNNKYIHTPRGIFEMKYFFHSGLSTAGGTDMSSLAVKEKIKALVEREEPRKPLSDAA
ncbi:MAG: RNA polymerase factor sigma-54, partial [Acidobacteriota bacterium]